jgi:hypothetical protein
VQENVPFIFNVDQGDSIQNAVNNAVDGDIINIASGTYSENLTIHRSLTINGGISGKTILKCDNKNCNEIVSISSGTKGVSLSGLIIDAGENSNRRCVTFESNNSNISFSDITFSNGIYSICVTDNANNVSFKNTNFKNNTKCCVHFSDRMQISNIIFNSCSFSSSLFKIPAISGKGAIINNLQFNNCSFKNVAQYY